MTDPMWPKHWISAKLGTIAEVRLGRQRSPSRAVGPNMVPYLRAANVTWSGLDLGDVKSMDFNAAEVETYRLRSGDILLSEASGSASEVGKPAIYHDDSQLHCFQNTLIRVRSPEQLSQFLHLHFVKDALLGGFAKASRGVGIHHLGAEALTEWPIVLPPLEEQQRIADAVDSYLSRLDAATASLERAQAKLKAYRASVLKAAVEGRLVPTEAALAREEKRAYEPAEVLLDRILKERRRRWEEAELARLTKAGKPPKDEKWKTKYEEPEAPDTTHLPPLPEGWCWATIAQLLIEPLANGKSVPDGQGFPVLRLTAIRNGSVDLTECKAGAWGNVQPTSFIVKSGDFLVVRGNGSLSLVGRGGTVGEIHNLVAFPDTLIRVRVAGVRTKLLSYVWDSPPVRQHIEKRAKTTAGIYKVNQTDLEQTWLPLAPLEEQDRIWEQLERLLSVSSATSTSIHRQALRIARLRQSILKWAFEGKLVDQDPNDEPAEVLLARIRGEREAGEAGKPEKGRRGRRGAGEGESVSGEKPRRGRKPQEA